MNENISTLARNWEAFSDPGSSQFELAVASVRRSKRMKGFQMQSPYVLTRRKVNYEQNSF